MRLRCRHEEDRVSSSLVPEATWSTLDGEVVTSQTCPGKDSVLVRKKPLAGFSPCLLRLQLF